jgi:uncharacterized protein with HEPN domain
VPPKRSWKIRIDDLKEAISKIQSFTRGMDFEAFRADAKTIDAVIRNLEVLGEAACHMPEQLREKYPTVPWGEMIGIRNMLIHEYFGVSHEILWETIQKDIPKLESTLLTTDFGDGDY